MSMKKFNVENHFAKHYDVRIQSLSTLQVFLNTLAPIHIALVKGSLETFKLIFDNVEYKNPVYNVRNGNTLFHMAANLGLTDQCKLIIENTDIKNPVNSLGHTPLHMAAWNGHFSICELIIENVENKNPANNGGYTPLHLAALNVDNKRMSLLNQNEHLAICELMIENFENKILDDIDGQEAPPITGQVSLGGGGSIC